MDNLFYIDGWDNQIHPVAINIDNYRTNDNFYMGLSLPNENNEPFGDITVNLTDDLPPYHAYLDADKFVDLKTFVEENNLGVFTGQTYTSGFATYQLYAFNRDLIEQLVPEQVKAYEDNLSKKGKCFYTKDEVNKHQLEKLYRTEAEKVLVNLFDRILDQETEDRVNVISSLTTKEKACVDVLMLGSEDSVDILEKAYGLVNILKEDCKSYKFTDQEIFMLKKDISLFIQRRREIFEMFNPGTYGYLLYQNTGVKGNDFISYENLKASANLDNNVNAAMLPDKSEYEVVYVSDLDKDVKNYKSSGINNTLDMLWAKFNSFRPEDYYGRSMSVSDIIVINDKGQKKALYVDSYGFKDVPVFLKHFDKEREQLTAKEEKKKEVVFDIKDEPERLRLFVDMDGTLAVFKPVDTLETLYEEGYFANLEPQQSVLDAVKQIVKNNPYIDVMVCSAYLTDSEYALKEKNEWLDRYLPEIPPERRVFLPCGVSKAEYIKDMFGRLNEKDFLLDDYTINLNDWEPPAKGIKLLNGINHTRGTWQSNRISSDRSSESIADAIESVVKFGAKIFDTPTNRKTTELKQ